MTHARRFLLAAIAGGLLSACGGGGGGSSTPPIVHTSTPVPTATPPLADDWTTYAHDDQRTGYETQVTGITAATVGSLGLAWRVQPDPSCQNTAVASSVIADEASPLVAGGMVYYADECGFVAALSATTGSIVWQKQISVSSLGGAQGTPTLDPVRNLLIVPMHGSDPSTPCSSLPCSAHAAGGFLVALNASTGQVVWQQAALGAGNLRGEPIAIGGVVYEGLAGGDAEDGGINGGIFALNETTGSLVGSTIPMVQAAPPSEQYDGGGSWTPISYDGTGTLYFGFGNTVRNDGYQDSVDQLNLSTNQLVQNFSLATYDGRSSDEDVGGGEMIWANDLYFEGKNGRYYGYSLISPNVPFADALLNATHPGDGPIWTPTTDGTVVAATSGYDTVTPQYSTTLSLFPVQGDTPICTLRATNSMLYSYAAFVNGVGFTGLDNDVPTGTPSGGANGPAPAFVAFDHHCTKLWSATPTDVLNFFYGGPAVVPSGVYAIDDMGNVYAWKLPKPSSLSVSRAAQSRALIRPGTRSTVRNTLYMLNVRRRVPE